jgi:hypothetical protein
VAKKRTKRPAKKPSAKKPSAKKPSAKKPSAKKPSAKKPSAKKCLSGAQWSKRKKQGLTSNRPGRPSGSVRMHQLYQDLTHGLFEKDPNWPGFSEVVAGERFSIAWQLSRHGDFDMDRLIRALRKHWPGRYSHLKDETLKRYIGALLPFIWKGGEYSYRPFPS